MSHRDENRPVETCDGPLPGSVTRRQVLQAGAAGGVALWVASVPAIAQAAGSARPAPDPWYLRRSSYAGRVGEPFDVLEKGILRLEAVGDLTHAVERGLADSDAAFVVLFAGDSSAPLAQGVHTFLRPGLAPAPLFVVPVGRPGPDQLYEVVVDRSVGLAGADPPRPSSPAVPWDSAAPGSPVTIEHAATQASGPEIKPHPRYAFLESVTLRRGRPGLRAELRFAKKAGLKSVSLRLTRDGVTYARGAADVRGRSSVFGLRLLHAVPRGRYEVVVAGTDRSGMKTVVRRSAIVS